MQIQAQHRAARQADPRPADAPRGQGRLVDRVRDPAPGRIPLPLQAGPDASLAVPLLRRGRVPAGRYGPADRGPWIRRPAVLPIPGWSPVVQHPGQAESAVALRQRKSSAVRDRMCVRVCVCVRV